MTETDHCITIVSTKLIRLLAVIAVLLVAASVALQAFQLATGHGTVYGIVPLFYVDMEANAPTFFSTTILLLASAVVGVIAVLKKNQGGLYVAQWRILAFLFLYIALDEAAGIHELLIRPMKELTGPLATGVFTFAWVIPAIPAVVLLAIMFLRFWLHLPTSTRSFVFVAAAIYLLGAIGVELIGGGYVDRFGKDFTYSMISTLEESLEMAGVIVFLFAMLEYFALNFKEVRFQIIAKPEE